MNLNAIEDSRNGRRSQLGLDRGHFDDAQTLYRRSTAANSPPPTPNSCRPCPGTPNIHPQAGALRETIEQSIGTRERARQLEEGINRARRLMVLENFEEAVEDLQALVHDHPDSPPARDLFNAAVQERDNRIHRNRLAAVLGEARTLLKKERFADAVDRLSQWRKEFPESGELRDLASFATDELRNQAQATAVAAVTSEAQSLVAQLRFDQAVDRLRQVLTEYPTATALRDLMQSIGAAQSEHERRTALDQVSVQAKSLLGEQRFGEALESIGAFDRAYGDDGQLEPLGKRAEAGLDQQRRQHAVRKVASDARTKLDANQPDSAIEDLRLGVTKFPDDPELRTLLKEAQQKLEEPRLAEKISVIISEAESLSRARQFERSLETLDQGLVDFPAQDRLLRCRQATLAGKARYDRVMAYGQAVEAIRGLMKTGHLDEALSRADTAIAELGEDPTLADLRCQIAAALESRADRAEVERIEAQAKALLAQGEPAAALKALNAAIVRFPAQDSLTKLKALADAQFRQRQRLAEIESVAAKARQDLEADQVDQAFQAVEAAVRRLGNEGPLVLLKEQILAAQGEAAWRESRREPIDGVRRLESGKRHAEALQRLIDALPKFDRDPELLALKSSLEAAIEAQRLEQEAADAIQMIEAAPQHLGDPRVAQVLASARQRLEEQHRLQASADVERHVQRLVEGGEFTQALKAVDRALRLESTSARLSKLRQSVLTAQETAQHLSAAQTAYAAGDSEQALADIQAALALSPTHTALRDLKRRVEGQIAQRLADAAIGECVAQGEQLLAANEPAEAIAILRPMSRKHPAEARLAQVLKADAQVFIDNKPYGLTDTRGELRTTIEIGDHAVRVEKQGFGVPPVQRVRLKVDPKPQLLTFTMNLLPGAPKLPDPPKNDPPVPSIVPPVAPPVLTAEAKEAQAWDRIKTAQDPDQIDAFLRDHPTSPHRQDAAKRLDDAQWARTNPADSASLQAYLKRNGARAGEAPGASSIKRTPKPSVPSSKKIRPAATRRKRRTSWTA